MNSQTWERETIGALNTLWRVLPIRGVTDEIGVLEDYSFALRNFSNEAIWSAVNGLREGSIDGASKTWCPSAPQLAEYVREHQKRVDTRNTPPPIPYRSSGSTEFKDWRIIQRDRTKELSQQGFSMLAEKIGHDEAVSRARRHAFPVGSIWFWCLQEVWGPRHAS